MANSKYEYVKQFEESHALLPNTYIVVRVDGKGFHKFTKYYDFHKPNDKKALELMNLSAEVVIKTFTDIFIAYGQSDEFSFVISKDSTLYNRRSDKIATCICSCFTSAYTYYFSQIVGKQLQPTNLPVFDSRCVCYPTLDNLRDYLSWRQVDCHINNLNNTCFWGLVNKGVCKQEAEQQLSKTNASGKNELLFTQVGINYNNEDEMFKKGTTLIKCYNQQPEQAEIQQQVQGIVISQEGEKESNQTKKQRRVAKNNKQQIQQQQAIPTVVKHLYVDIIKDDFWDTNKQNLKL